MIVTGSNIQMTAKHQQASKTEEFERLEKYRVDAEGRILAAEIHQNDRISISGEAKLLAQGLDAAEVPVATGTTEPLNTDSGGLSAPAAISEDMALDPQTAQIRWFVEAMLGHKIELAGSSDVGSGGSLTVTAANTVPDGGGVAVRYNAFSYYEEHEALDFAARGSVQLADGRSIDINMAMHMSRDYVSQSQITIEAGAKLKDPLVINFDGRGAQLASDKFTFDIDGDGTAEQINRVSSGSGILMLDQNGNGRADSGNELFGAKTGNGFAELAKYDEDGNGFIDEGDSVYARLKVWVKGPDGQDQYSSLADKGVGAIYLGAIDTEFSYKDASNELQGKLRSSSIYLNESGGVGAVQQIDLVV